MDIFAHGLWTGISYKTIKRKSNYPLRVWLATFWGVFPDFFAFSLPFIYMFGSILFGGMSLSDFRPHTQMEPTAHQFPMYDLANTLYNYSHSLIIFALVFILVAVLRQKPVWEMGGWLLHILIDIPTHSYKFFPTPFFWPISDLRFDGFSWGTPMFMTVNYSLIVICFLVIYLTKRKFV